MLIGSILFCTLLKGVTCASNYSCLECQKKKTFIHDDLHCHPYTYIHFQSNIKDLCMKPGFSRFYAKTQVHSTQQSITKSWYVGLSDYLKTLFMLKDSSHQLKSCVKCTLNNTYVDRQTVPMNSFHDLVYGSSVKMNLKNHVCFINKIDAGFHVGKRNRRKPFLKEKRFANRHNAKHHFMSITREVIPRNVISTELIHEKSFDGCWSQWFFNLLMKPKCQVAKRYVKNENILRKTNIVKFSNYLTKGDEKHYVIAQKELLIKNYVDFDVEKGTRNTTYQWYSWWMKLFKFRCPLLKGKSENYDIANKKWFGLNLHLQSPLLKTSKSISHEDWYKQFIGCFQLKSTPQQKVLSNQAIANFIIVNKNSTNDSSDEKKVRKCSYEKYYGEKLQTIAQESIPKSVTRNKIEIQKYLEDMSESKLLKKHQTISIQFLDGEKKTDLREYNFLKASLKKRNRVCGNVDDCCLLMLFLMVFVILMKSLIKQSMSTQSPRHQSHVRKLTHPLPTVAILAARKKLELELVVAIVEISPHMTKDL